MDHWWILWLLLPNNSSPGPRKVNLFILYTMLKLNIFAQKKPQFYFASKLQFLAKIHINLLKSINNSFNIEMVQTRSPFYPVDICKGCVCVCVEECSYLHWVWSFSKYTVDSSISSKKKKIFNWIFIRNHLELLLSHKTAHISVLGSLLCSMKT